MKKGLKRIFIIIGSISFLFCATNKGVCSAEERTDRKQIVEEFNKNNPVREISSETIYDESEKLLIQTRIMLPKVYNVDGAIGTPVKRQGEYNCWAYASAALAEHNAYRQMNGVKVDFSEDYIDYLGSKDSLGTDRLNPYANGLSWNLKNGGNFRGVEPFYLQNQLPIAEESFKRPENFGAVSITDLQQKSTLDVKSAIHLGFMGYGPISSEKRTERIQSIKAVIYQYGAVSYTYNTFSQLFSSDIYNSEMDGENHQVVLIGWDDTYSKSNFIKKKGDTIIQPEIDGAFIMKNSWGEKTADGKDFYYHVSYDDAYLKGFIDGLGEVGLKEYDYAYIPGNTNYPVSSDVSSIYESFNKNSEKEMLSEVFVPIKKIGVAYEIYLNPENDKMEGMTKIYSGRTNFNSGERISLEHPISITAEEKFALVIKATNGETAPFIWTKVNDEILPDVHNQGKYSYTSSANDDLTSYNWINFKKANGTTELPKIQVYTKKDNQISGYFGSVKWTWTDETQTVTFLGGDFPKTSFETTICTQIENDPQLNGKKIKNIVFTDCVVADASSSNLFANLEELTCIDGLQLLDTSKVKDMVKLFQNCYNLKEVDVSNWQTSQVTEMLMMFYGCRSLTHVNADNWDTSNVQSMRSMFDNCSKLKKVSVSNWNTSKVRYMDSMFYQCYQLEELDVSNWDTSQVFGTNMKGMFYYCKSLKQLDVSKWNIDKVTNLDLVFSECMSLERLDVSNWNTENVSRFYATFCGCESLNMLDVSTWNTSNATTMYCMFWNCRSLKELDIAHFDTTKVTDMGHMFNRCLFVKPLDVSNWDTSKVKSVHFMFGSLKKELVIGVSNWDLTSVENRTGFYF